MRPAEMDEIMARHYAAEAEHDLDALMRTLADEVEHDVVGDPAGVLREPETIRARYTRLFADLADQRVEPLRRLYGEDFVVDEAMITARATGTMLGLPGGNRPVAFRLMHILEFRDGRISRENVWMDTAVLVEQLTTAEPAGAH